jgi:hypothetical protein
LETTQPETRALFERIGRDRFELRVEDATEEVRVIEKVEELKASGMSPHRASSGGSRSCAVVGLEPGHGAVAGVGDQPLERDARPAVDPAGPLEPRFDGPGSHPCTGVWMPRLRRHFAVPMLDVTRPRLRSIRPGSLHPRAVSAHGTMVDPK